MVRLLSFSDALQMLELEELEPQSKQIEKDDELVGADSLRRAAKTVREMRSVHAR